MITHKMIDKVLTEFIQENDKDGSYASGYCMDLAMGLGTVLEDLGERPEYWEYGSEGEPQVHVVVANKNIPYDSTLSYSFGEIIGLGDFYTETECDWYPLKKREIVGWAPDNKIRNMKEYKEIARLFKEYFNVEVRESVVVPNSFRIPGTDVIIKSGSNIRIIK